MQRSRRILYMSRQRPFGSLLKRLLSHSRNKDSRYIRASSPSIFDIHGLKFWHWLMKKREMEILPLRVSVTFVKRQVNKRANPLRAVDFPESRSRC